MSQKEPTWWDVAYKLLVLAAYAFVVWHCRFGIIKILIWMTKP